MGEAEMEADEETAKGTTTENCEIHVDNNISY